MFIVSAELDIKLGMSEIKNIYMIKKNSVDRGRVYISSCSCRDHMLMLLKSTSNWKDTFFFIFVVNCL